MLREIVRCRVCGNSELVQIVDLGTQALTGVFPESVDQAVESSPLVLVKCWGGTRDNACGLVQLRHSFEPERMYGLGYGYRSGLNSAMVEHLRLRAAKAKALVSLRPGDVVLDIGSNDGTLLRELAVPGVTLVGMDPTAAKFREFYPPDARVIPDFFSSRLFRGELGSKKARLVTSIAMFYDLECPMEFVRQVAEVLEDDGIWVFEQSYLPTMLEMNSYDTICHEHLEYYALRQIHWMTERAGLRILDFELNDANGGSFCVTAAKATSSRSENGGIVNDVLRREELSGLDGLEVHESFRRRVSRHKDDLQETLEELGRAGKRVFGYGASTKGNVILQYCGVTPREVEFIAEINPDKFGRFTPGTRIPIIPEEQARTMRPDVFLVLPWHFRKTIVSRETRFLGLGGKLLFPLPRIEVV